MSQVLQHKSHYQHLIALFTIFSYFHNNNVLILLNFFSSLLFNLFHLKKWIPKCIEMNIDKKKATSFMPKIFLFLFIHSQNIYSEILYYLNFMLKNFFFLCVLFVGYGWSVNVNKLLCYKKLSLLRLYTVRKIYLKYKN